MKEVISPLSKLLGEKLSYLNLTISDKVELISGKDGYFPLLVGEQVLGGISYPGPDTSYINFTIFAHGKPSGKVIKITKISQLEKVVSNLIKFLDLT